MGEAIVFENFTDSDDVSFFIWYFDPDESNSWDWCLNTDTFCLEGEGEIFFEGFDPRETDSFRRSETILDHGRSDTLLFHLDIDAKLEKCLLDHKRLFLDLICRDEILVCHFIEELDTREIPRSKVDFCLSFLFNDFSFWSLERDFFTRKS